MNFFKESIKKRMALLVAFTLSLSVFSGTSFTIMALNGMEQTSTDAHKHEWDSGEVTREATCTTTGRIKYSCKQCDATKEQALDILGHSYSKKWTIDSEATCTEEGKKSKRCVRCKKRSSVTVIEATGHDYDTITKKATVKKNGSTYKKCADCGATTKKTVVYAAKTVKLVKSAYTYTGKNIKPKVIVKNNKNKLINKKYYTVTYKNNKSVGTATVTIKFKGLYTGTVKKEFTIEPITTNIKTVKAKSKAVTVNWTKKTAQVTGYEIQTSQSKRFTGNTTKITTVKGNKKNSVTVEELDGNRKYYARIRTYKTVKINGENVEFYSDWSKAKSVRTKR